MEYENKKPLPERGQLWNRVGHSGSTTYVVLGVKHKKFVSEVTLGIAPDGVGGKHTLAAAVLLSREWQIVESPVKSASVIECPQCEGRRGYYALCMTTYDPNYGKDVWVDCAGCGGFGSIDMATRESGFGLLSGWKVMDAYKPNVGRGIGSGTPPTGGSAVQPAFSAFEVSEVRALIEGMKTKWRHDCPEQFWISEDLDKLILKLGLENRS